jgi:integrase
MEEGLGMAMERAPQRDVLAIRLPRWGRVVTAEGVVPWQLLGAEDRPVEPVQGFLRDLVAQDASPASVRSYAFDLLRWWRFLAAVDIAWDRATSAEVRDLVLWLGRVQKPVAASRTASVATAGTTNPVTGKPYLGDGYAARTIRHSNAVLRAFYDFWIAEGRGPLVNPVPRERAAGGGRTGAHHNPLQPFIGQGRLRYNPRLPRRAPRAIPDAQWTRLFEALRSDRDRAIVAVAVSTGARAGELLGIRGGDVDWSEQLVQVRRKGTRAEQWLPASSDAFVWLRLYLSQIGNVAPGDPLWQTLRRRRVPGSDVVGREVSPGSGVGARRALSYEALRAVIRRANAVLGTNWSMHDLRHTAALRMVRDGRLSLRDAQVILGHAHLATTALYLTEDDDAVIARVRAHLAGPPAGSTPPASTAGATGLLGPAGQGYDPDDLAVLFARPSAGRDV